MKNCVTCMFLNDLFILLLCIQNRSAVGSIVVYKIDNYMMEKKN